MKDLTMKEYKQKKDEFKRELNNLIHKFNKETGTLIEDISVDVKNIYQMGVAIDIAYVEIDITTNLDK